MNRIPVSSQGILEVGYHEDADSRGTLELKFSNGGVYEFFNVPTKMYDEFMHAPSRDDYYRTNIGKRFPCTRVGERRAKSPEAPDASGDREATLFSICVIKRW